MKIANADRLKHHFENLVDVKLFTPAQILTIIDTFSVEIPEGTAIVLPRGRGMRMMQEDLREIMDTKPGIIRGTQQSEGNYEHQGNA